MSVSEDMLNGDVCQCCGVWIGEGYGFPQSCDNCDDEYDEE